MEKKYFQIEDVAKKTGLTKRALRYYEDIELIKPTRTEASYRLYTEDDLENIIRIKTLRDSLGFSLLEIKEVFDLEQDLKAILSGAKKDNELIDKSINLIKHQVRLIEEKEHTLHQVKGKYKETLTKLELLGGKNEE